MLNLLPQIGGTMPNMAPPAIQFGPRAPGMPLQPPAPTMQQPQQQGGMPEIMALLAAMKGGQSGLPGSQLANAVSGGSAQKIQGMPEWVGGLFNNLKAGGTGGDPTNPVGGVLQDSLGGAGGAMPPQGMPPGMPQGMPAQPMPPFNPATVQPVTQEMLPPMMPQQMPPLMPFGWGNFF